MAFFGFNYGTELRSGDIAEPVDKNSYATRKGLSFPWKPLADAQHDCIAWKPIAIRTRDIFGNETVSYGWECITDIGGGGRSELHPPGSGYTGGGAGSGSGVVDVIDNEPPSQSATIRRTSPSSQTATKRREVSSIPATRRRQLPGTQCSVGCSPKWAPSNSPHKCSVAREKEICSAFADIVNCISSQSPQKGFWTSILDAMKDAFCKGNYEILCEPGGPPTPTKKECTPDTLYNKVKNRKPFGTITLCDPGSFNFVYGSPTGISSSSLPGDNQIWIKLQLVHDLTHAIGGNELDAEVIENICSQPSGRGFTEPTPDDYTELCEKATGKKATIQGNEKWRIGAQDFIAGKFFAMSLSSGNVYRVNRDPTRSLRKSDVDFSQIVATLKVVAPNPPCNWGVFPVLN